MLVDRVGLARCHTLSVTSQHRAEPVGLGLVRPDERKLRRLALADITSRSQRAQHPGRLGGREPGLSIATGDGIAMAFVAGARVADLEFVQFHPTALAVPGSPAFLLSEALRGEGARLVNAAGEAFMRALRSRGRPGAARPGGARDRPRVASAPARRSTSLCAHCRPDAVHARFPLICRAVPRAGLDLASDRMPVSPAAHYVMGGVRHRPRRPHVAPRPVCRRRGGLHGRARRQPAGEQLAARGPRVRRPRRRCDARRRHGGGRCPRRAASWHRRRRPTAARRFRCRTPARRTSMWRDVGLFRDRARAAAALETLEPAWRRSRG